MLIKLKQFPTVQIKTDGNFNFSISDSIIGIIDAYKYLWLFHNYNGIFYKPCTQTKGDALVV